MSKDFKFKIGDTVKGVCKEVEGYVGTVVYIDDFTTCRPYGVDFGEMYKGHTLGGKLDTMTGWWCAAEESIGIEETCKPSTFRDPESGALCECQVPEENTSEEPVCCAEPQYYDAHYGGAIQPIELMQMIMTPEEFKGFLKGNIIKYTMRYGKKDDPEKELTKIRRYKQWLDLAEAGETINPRF